MALLRFSASNVHRVLPPYCPGVLAALKSLTQTNRATRAATGGNALTPAIRTPLRGVGAFMRTVCV
jgi:hypothetical protein